ncbi:MAG: hypothetical protein ACYS76_07010 [Planctomycetota bacterium]|jgi:hypothetical protein
MPDEKCTHVWEMANVARGLIVMKKCFHCGKVSTCFCFHDRLPLEPCREEEHFWNFVEGDPAFHFDLKCTRCGVLVKLRELVGLVRCIGCDEKCEVDHLRRKIEPDGVSVLIALGRRPIDERKQLPVEKIAVLQEYFDQQADLLKSKVTMVPHEMVRNIASCYAEVIKDPDSLFTAASKTDDRHR